MPLIKSLLYFLFLWNISIVGNNAPKNTLENTPKNVLNDSLNAFYKNFYQIKFNKLLKKEAGVSDFISIETQGIKLFSSLKNKKSNKYEFFMAWDELKTYQNKNYLKNYLQKYIKQENDEDSLFVNFSTNIQKNDKKQPIDIKLLLDIIKNPNKKPLLGYRIAIDPGHVSADTITARIEGRIVEIRLPNPANNGLDSIKTEIMESSMAWATAKVMKDSLEKLGAKVLLTREGIRYVAGENRTYLEIYEEYKNERKRQEKPFLTRKKYFYDVFLKQDLEKRAKIINDFNPDITIIIHFNVEANNLGWKKTVKNNFALALVGGAFTTSSLNSPKARFQLFRLLISDEIENSILLSQKVLAAHETILKVPTLPVKHTQKPLEKTWLYTGTQGVYARNLFLTKEVFGVLCYGESLLQDNEKEILLLNKKDFLVDGVLVSSRTKTVADAYLKGIFEYLKIIL